VSAAGGTAPYTYSWNTSPVQTTATASALAAGNYTVTVTDVRGCSKNLTVNTPNSGSLSAAVKVLNHVACKGGNDGVVAAELAGGTAPFTFDWSNGANNDTISGLPAGGYRVWISDANGCRFTDTIDVSEPLLPLNVQTKAQSDYCKKGNGYIVLTVSGGTGAYLYGWSHLASEQDSVAEKLPAGAYVATVTDAKGCKTQANAVIQEASPLLAKIDSITHVSCFGKTDGMVHLTVNGGNGSLLYNWGGGDQTVLPEGFNAGNYYLQIKDTAGCLANLEFKITEPTQLVALATVEPVSCYGSNDGKITIQTSGGSPDLSYIWSDGSNAPSRTGLAGGSYWLTVSDNAGCSVLIEDIRIEEPAVLSVMLTAKDPDCSGIPNGSISSTVTGGTTPYDYKWSNNMQAANLVDLADGIYTLKVSDRNGCADKAEASLRQKGNFNVEITGPEVICEGETANLEARVAGGHGSYTFSWDHGVTGNSFSAAPKATSTYNVYVSDQEGCSRDTSFTVKVNPLPLAEIKADEVTGCVPFCARLTAEGIADYLYYNWISGDGSAYSGKEIRPCYNEPGLYPVKLKLTDSAGCTNLISWNQQIIVKPSPQALLGANRVEAPLEDPVFHFHNMSKGASSFRYAFGDPSGSTSTLESPLFTYSDSGTYEVKLIVSNEAGCSDSSTIKVMVQGMERFYLPTAFTPDMDGINDYFVPTRSGQSAFGYEMRIFNRWGEEIFFTDQWEKGWDGTFRGQKVQAGSYICKVRYYSKSGKPAEQITAVTLVE
jgi:gliding motility-associated-like protein